jgi:ring-1,2-phenylacetyl-CoA epoxidase subunit PaaC
MTVIDATTSPPAALGHLILGLRDSKQILAREMTMGAIRAPSLETDIALAAMAQDELGHAQMLAAIHVHEFAGDGERAERVRLDDPATHPAALPFSPRTESWPEMVALLCLWDSAVATILDALAASSFTTLHNTLGKMRDEEAHHWIFARAAAADLLARDGGAPKALRDACKAMLPRVQHWLDEIGDLASLRREGLVPDAVPMARFASRLGPLLEDMKLTWPAPAGAGAR